MPLVLMAGIELEADFSSLTARNCSMLSFCKGAALGSFVSAYFTTCFSVFFAKGRMVDANKPVPPSHAAVLLPLAPVLFLGRFRGLPVFHILGDLGLRVLPSTPARQT